LILKKAIFIEKINQALDFAAEHDALLTLGISPTRPDTSYGYIEYEVSSSEYQVSSSEYQESGGEYEVSSSEYQVSSSEYQVSGREYQELSNGIHKVNAFKEKPVLEKAQEYIARGNYLWNAGIFIWKAANLQKAFEKYAPEIDTLFKSGNEIYNTPDEAKLYLINIQQAQIFPLTMLFWKRQIIFIPFQRILAGLIWAHGPHCTPLLNRTNIRMYVIRNIFIYMIRMTA